MAVLALSLVAGFVARQDAGCRVKISENTTQVVNLSITVPYAYNYAQLSLSPFQLRSDEPVTLAPEQTKVEISDKGYMQSAQFFVTWGAFTLFYGVIAIVVYMTTTANEKIEWFVNFLVLVVSRKAVGRDLVM